jgi:hypothetical protein
MFNKKPNFICNFYSYRLNCAHECALNFKEKKMQMIKKITIAIALLLTISMSASLMLIPTASAHNPAWEIPTYAYIQALPNPVGVGQSITVYVFLDKTFGSLPGTVNSNAALTNTYRFHNYQVVITAPDNKTETRNFDYISDPTSAQEFSFTPSEVGIYMLNFTFLGQRYDQYPGGYNPTSPLVNDTYMASTASTNLIVQEEPLPDAISSYPLPTEYWTRPIYGENSYWYTISSNWLGTGSPQFWAENFGKNAYIPDAVGSLTAHVMWTKPLQSGGVVGGNMFSSAPGVEYWEGSAYNNRFSNPIIMDGMLFYTEPVSFTSSASAGPTDCVDLRTGQLIWSRSDVPALSFGYIYNLWDPNQHGTLPPILFTTNFAQAFDADTGDPLFNVTGVPSGTATMGPNGELLRYVITNNGTTANPQWMLAEWNSTNLWNWAAGLSPTLYNASNGVAWRMTGGALPSSYSFIVNGGSGSMYDWNVTLNWLNYMGNQTLSTVTLANATTVILKGYSASGSNPDASNPAVVIWGGYDDILLCRNGTLPSAGTAFYAESYSPYTYFAVDLNSSHSTLGNILWMQTYNPPAGNLTVLDSGFDPVARVFYETHRETMQYIAYSMDTGNYLWGPTLDLSEVGLSYYGNDFGGIQNGQCAYGRLYQEGFSGIMYCYNETNGDLLWTYGNGGEGNSTYGGLNIFYGYYPTFIQAIGNGVIYTDTTEHTITNPIYKGALVRAINATTGQEIWTLSAYTGGGNNVVEYAIADGFTTFFNGYDNQIYSVGRGPSATTVTAPAAGLAFGQPVVISGSVMDISAGTKQDQQAADFPNGVPCVSDASMSDWMGYVYQQKPEPANVTGVEVVLSVVDANNNCREIGTTTSDANGFFRYTWTPDIPGDYAVYASFEGSNGYWPSQAESAFTVMEEPEATPGATPMPQSAADLYFVPAVIGIIVAIVVVGALLALLLLRKKP